MNEFREWLTVTIKACPAVVEMVDRLNITSFREMWDRCDDSRWLLDGLRYSPRSLTKEQAVTLVVTFASHRPPTSPEGKACLKAAKAWLADPTEANRLAAADAAAADDAAAAAAVPSVHKSTAATARRSQVHCCCCC